MTGSLLVKATMGIDDINIPVNINGVAGVTPTSYSFDAGNYNCTATYLGQTLTPQAISIVDGQTTSLTLSFTAPPTVEFSGVVTAQTQAGETISIQVTKPDSTIETVVTVTLADKTYSIIKQYAVAGSYKAKAHGDADALYSAWDSPEVLFTITIQRAGTLKVTIP